MTDLQLRHITPGFRTYSGRDSLDRLAMELDRSRTSRAVIVCSPSVRRHSSAFGLVEDALGARLVGCFDGVRAHSPLHTVEAVRDVLRSSAADSVVVVGGGSAIVTARAASILLAEDRDAHALSTRRDGSGRLTSPRLSAPKLPQWVVPTTPTTAYAKAGSAVRDDETRRRLALFDPKTRAQGIFLHPDLALTAPVSLARTSTLSALAMAIDGLQADADDPLADAMLAHAIRLITQWLPLLESTPSNPEPRLRLMLAALLSGQGSDHTGMGLTQTLAHAASARSTTSNGALEAILLPHTVKFNAPTTAERLPQIAAALASPCQSPGIGPQSVVDAVEELIAGFSPPRRLRDVGIERHHLREIVEDALDDWTTAILPRPTTGDDLTQILHDAW